MRTPLALVAALLLVAGAGCSGDDVSPATPTSTQPGSGGGAIQAAPGARLVDSSGKEAISPAGTRCWGNACVDMIGPLTVPTPVVLRVGEPLTASFDAGQPTTAQYTWVSGPRKLAAPVSGGLVAWEPPQVTGGVKAATPLRAPDSPGEYLLTVFATWQGKGDISYAWYVRVE